MQKIFDVHCHIYPEKIAQKASNAIGNFYGVKMSFDGSLKSLDTELDKAGTTVLSRRRFRKIPKGSSEWALFIL